LILSENRYPLFRIMLLEHDREKRTAVFPRIML